MRTFAFPEGYTSDDLYDNIVEGVSISTLIQRRKNIKDFNTVYENICGHIPLFQLKNSVLIKDDETKSRNYISKCDLVDGNFCYQLNDDAKIYMEQELEQYKIPDFNIGNTIKLSFPRNDGQYLTRKINSVEFDVMTGEFIYYLEGMKSPVISYCIEPVETFKQEV